MHLESKLEMERLGRSKFRSLKWQVYSLFLAILLTVVGAIMGYFDPEPHSRWLLLCLGSLYPFAYGANEVFKVKKLEWFGWFICYDCRRPTPNKKMCTAMEGGVVKEVCQRCRPHFDTSPQSNRPVRSFLAWLQGTLGYKKVDCTHVEPGRMVID